MNAPTVSVFTPGPWCAVSFKEGRGLGWSVISPAHHNVARVYSAQYGMGGSAEANARLIAAAPDMHRALTDLLELVRVHGLEPCNDIPMHEFEAIVDGVCQDASRALGKVSA